MGSTLVTAQELFLKAAADTAVSTKQSPVIGIVTQTLEWNMKSDQRFANYTSYVMSAYVKQMQASGARVVPIILGEDPKVTLTKLNSLWGSLSRSR